MRYRDRRQSLVLVVFVDLPFAFQDLSRRRPTHRLVRFIHFRQQFQIGLRETTRKPVLAAAGSLYLAVLHIPADQPRYLRPA